MLIKEAELITQEYLKTANTYNLCTGGKGGFFHINDKKLNDRTGTTIKPENLRKMNAARLAKPVSEQTRKKMSSSNAMKNCPVTRKKLAASLTGKTKSDEHKKRIAESVKRHHQAKKSRG